MTSKVIYKGNLRTESIHIKSGNQLITDAPTDNNGKGEAFSPTDLVATALANCMLTIMGIRANNMGINIDGASAEIVKIMASNPRRIAEVQVQIHMPNQGYSEKDMKILEAAARSCPVALSLHPDTVQTVSFNWG